MLPDYDGEVIQYNMMIMKKKMGRIFDYSRPLLISGPQEHFDISKKIRRFCFCCHKELIEFFSAAVFSMQTHPACLIFVQQLPCNRDLQKLGILR